MTRELFARAPTREEKLFCLEQWGGLRPGRVAAGLVVAVLSGIGLGVAVAAPVRLLARFVTGGIF